MKRCLTLPLCVVLTILLAGRTGFSPCQGQEPYTSCQNIGFPEILAAMERHGVEMSVTGGASRTGGVTKPSCGIALLAWRQKPDDLSRCLMREIRIRAELDDIVEAMPEEMRPQSISYSGINCFDLQEAARRQALAESPRLASTNESGLVYKTGRGSGQHDKMTYDVYEAFGSLEPSRAISVDVLAPEVWYCNGECALRAVIIDQDGSVLTAASAVGTSAADLQLKLAQPVLLRAGRSYRIYLKASGTKAIGIYTAGMNNELRPGGRLRALWARQSERGIPAFELYGTALQPLPLAERSDREKAEPDKALPAHYDEMMKTLDTVESQADKQAAGNGSSAGSAPAKD